MFQPKMIELENQINCSQKHKQPILMVMFDKKLKREERLLCAHCMDDIESESKIIGFKKTLKMIEENQLPRIENIQRLIKVNQDMVEQLINQFHKLKSSLNQQLDELISNSITWIENLHNIGEANAQYSFLDELEVLINSPNENIFNYESINEQIKLINNSICTKINIKLSNLKNQDLYSQCETTLSSLNLSPHIKRQDNSIKQIDDCFALSFNLSGSLMISASNCQIKVWEFVDGILNETTTLSGHTYKQSNSFLSSGFDNSTCCWNQINEKEWKSSQFYQKHTDCINCLVINQSENQLISGGQDHLIIIWKINFEENQLHYLYSLDKHTNHISSLCLNQSDNILISCDDYQQIIWKKDNQQKWQFENVVIVIKQVIEKKFVYCQIIQLIMILIQLSNQNYNTQTFKASGSRLCFINNEQFILAITKEVGEYISIFELQNGQHQSIPEKEELKLIENYQNGDANLFPICYNKEKNLIIFKHQLSVYLIKISNEGKLQMLAQINYLTTFIVGTLTNNGRYLVIWEQFRQKFDIYEISII